MEPPSYRTDPSYFFNRRTVIKMSSAIEFLKLDLLELTTSGRTDRLTAALIKKAEAEIEVAEANREQFISQYIRMPNKTPTTPPA